MWHVTVALFALICISSSLTASPGLIEGDMVLDSDLFAKVTGMNKGYDGSTRNHWTNGIVPYVFHSEFNQKKRDYVYKAIAEYNKYTCVKFVPRSSEKNYVQFMNGGGCYSYIGMTGGRQNISIGDGCEVVGIVIHEMMHAIGFYHEQSRLDRDSYIKVIWQNIHAGTTYNFKKYSHGEADYYGEPYDYNSVMQYGNYAFGGGKKTIEVIGDPERILGQRDGFSQIDVRQINTMYKCRGGKPTPPAVTRPPCVDSKKSCKDWARMGHCVSNAGYMKIGCPESCGLCTGKGGKTSAPVTTSVWTQPPTTSRPVVTSGQCYDLYSGCKNLVTLNYCVNKPKYSEYWCKKSCGICSPVICTDNDPTLCPVWAKSGYCQSNPVTMSSYCKKSCKIC